MAKNTVTTAAVARPRKHEWMNQPGAVAEFMGFISSGGNLADFSRAKGIDYQTFSDWIYKDAERASLYDRAREERAEKLVDEIVSISDEEAYDDVLNADGSTSAVRFDSTAVARNKLRVDTRKWVASKLKPRKYGDRNTQEIVGPEGGPLQLASLNLRGLNDAELAQMEALLAKAAKSRGE